jgi:hypothetical protein
MYQTVSFHPPRLTDDQQAACFALALIETLDDAGRGDLINDLRGWVLPQHKQAPFLAAVATATGTWISGGEE